MAFITTSHGMLTGEVSGSISTTSAQVGLEVVPNRGHAADFRRRLVLAQTFHRQPRAAVASVQVRYLTSATSSGRTQCTRLKTSGALWTPRTTRSAGAIQSD